MPSAPVRKLAIMQSFGQSAGSVLRCGSGPTRRSAQTGTNTQIAECLDFQGLSPLLEQIRRFTVPYLKITCLGRQLPKLAPSVREQHLHVRPLSTGFRTLGAA
jgi:hypothetical protein